VSGKVSFPVIVEVGFGAGPMDDPVTWTDVSDYVQRGKTITCSRGFDVETTEPTPGRGQLRFKNDDGRFTPGETGAFGLVRNRLPIRISARVGTGTGNPLVYDDALGWYDMAGATYDDAEIGTLVLWTGLIEKLSMGFEEGYRPVVDATLVDRWARFRKRVLTGELISTVVERLAPDQFWRLTDLPGSGRFEDSMPGGWSLTPVSKNLPTWGGGTNPGGSSLPAVMSDASGVTLSSGAKTNPADRSALTISMLVKASATSQASLSLTSSASAAAVSLVADLDYSSAFADWFIGAASSKSITAGSVWRHYAMTVTLDGSRHPTVTAYLDGQAGTPDVGVDTLPNPWLPGMTAKLSTTGPGTVQVAYAAVWSRALSAAEIAGMAAAGVGALGATGDTADVRADLIAALWPTPVLTTAGTFTATMSKQAIDGVSQADLLLACATAEAGTVSIARDGWPLLTSRGYRTEAALTATIPAKVLSKAAQWELDDAQIWNAVQVDRMALAETVTTVNRRDEASIATYDEVTRSFQLWLDSDVQAVDRANTEAVMWSQTVPRSRTFAVDVATCQAALSQADVLAIDVGSRIVISGLPATAPDQSAAGWYVDAVEDSIGMDTWMRTFTVSPAIDFLVLDDATFGGLDEFPLG